MLPALSIGRLSLPTAPLTLLIGAWLALLITEKAAQKLLPAQAEKVNGLATLALLSGFLGARLVFVASHWSAYQNDWLGIVWPLTTGFNGWAGLIIGMVVAFFYGRFHNLPLAATLDTLTPALLIALNAISLADFLSGPGYGTLSNLPWAISLFGVRRHPVQLYEVAFGLAALALWWRTSEQRLYTGQLFLTAVALYSAGRLWVDAFHDNALLTSNGYHTIQIICLIALLAALSLLLRQAPASQPT